MIEQLIKSQGELHEFAELFTANLTPGEAAATVVGLSGDLGSGKTAFTKEFASALGISEVVLSPTFVLAKFYDLPFRSRWRRFAHIDLYRVESEEELGVLGWKALLADPRNLIVVEWPERAGKEFPADARMLQFTFVNESTRQIKTTN